MGVLCAGYIVVVPILKLLTAVVMVQMVQLSEWRTWSSRTSGEIPYDHDKGLLRRRLAVVYCPQIQSKVVLMRLVVAQWAVQADLDSWTEEKGDELP